MSTTNNWTLHKLSDLVKCQGGVAFPPALQGKRTGEIAFYKVSDMNLPGNEWFMRAANNYISSNEAQELNGSVKPAGSVIFPKVGAAIHTNKKRLLTSPSLIDNNVMAVWPLDPKQCNSEFLYLYFLTENLSDLSNPGPLPSINSSAVYEREILLPEPTEQLQIVTALSTLREAIEVQLEYVTRARDLKIALLHHYFGDKGVTGPNPANPWLCVPLGQYVTAAQYGLSIRGQESGLVPILRMNCQVDGRVVFEDLQYVDIDRKTLDAFKLKDGDLLFNRTNSHELVGRMAVFRSPREAVFASYLVRLTLDQEAFHPEFLNFFFNQAVIQADLKRLASRGVSQSNISASKLKEFAVPKPDLDLQRAIASGLETVDREILLHEDKLQKLQRLFKSLLGQLVSGQLSARDIQLPKLH